jgi:choline dehydrogenase-like flavoprotein
VNGLETEYVVVGSGAGGGTIAARLAEAGRRVVVLEAGGDPYDLAGGDALEPDRNRLPFDYDVPAFHAFASENDAMKWDFFVRHYVDDAQQALDPKYVRSYAGVTVDGVLYPRASALGGCTAHNAMIFVAPHNDDWDAIAALTGDDGWNAKNMRRYFERIEDCRHRPFWRWLGKLGINPTRHGWGGWLSTESAIPLAALDSVTLLRTLFESARAAVERDGHPLKQISWLLQSQGDPNDWRVAGDKAVGIRYLPLTTRNHQRVGARERLLDVERRFPDRLRIITGALATRVRFDGDRAVGVDFLRGDRLYGAAQSPDGPATAGTVDASREVILAGGAFNTPQLLMLSGIGPPDVLRSCDIPVRVALAGVGANLQDRYEVAVVNRMRKPWDAYEGARFEPGDPIFEQWQRGRDGVYTSNGGLLTVVRRSPVAVGPPDLFCMAMLTRFVGYYPQYSRDLAQHLDCLTWLVLKAHTRNRRGQVTLRSADPRTPPAVTFHYFDEGGDDDLAAVVDGVRFVRRVAAPLREQGLIREEELPGDAVHSDDDLRAYVRDTAWGHHASCSCPIGPADAGGVLSSDLRVHGVRGLRVVDASAFPKIPGFFIASAVYMLAEKAADAVLTDTKHAAGQDDFPHPIN